MENERTAGRPCDACDARMEFRASLPATARVKLRRSRRTREDLSDPSAIYDDDDDDDDGVANYEYGCCVCCVHW